MIKSRAVEIPLNSFKEEINDKIEKEPKTVLHYFRRAVFYLSAHFKNEAKADIEKMIELSSSKEDAELLYAIGNLVTHFGRKSDAVTIFTKAISIIPDDPKYYVQRASCFSSQQYRDAEADYSKAIEIEPSNPIYFIERADFLSEFNVLNRRDEALADYNKAIEMDVLRAESYSKRATFFEKLKKYKDALSDYNRAIELNQYNSLYFFNRGLVFKQQKEYDKALEDLDKAIELDSFDEIHPSYAFFERGKIHEKLNHYQLSVQDFNISIEQWKFEPNPDFYFYRGNLFFRLEHYQEAIADYNKVIEINSFAPNGECGEVYARRGEAYYALRDFQKAYDDLNDAFIINRELVGYFTDISEVQEKLTEQHKNYTRVEERNKVIADLAHSIKNLIATVIDPLENLKRDAQFQPQIIENALRGANLIREIVNAMNLSYKGAIDDFYHDARHNSGKDGMSLGEMVAESLKQATGNMFDGKYFRNFMVKYFPSKDSYVKAKKEWESVSQAESLDAITPFLERWFFTPEIFLGNVAELRIGNEKGSAVKLLILFQELILNAVKYSAYTTKENRFVRIDIIQTPGQITLTVENPFDPTNRAKTTGLGHIIIDNFAKILSTKPKIMTTGEIYSIKISFRNFWIIAHENLVCGR